MLNTSLRNVDNEGIRLSVRAVSNAMHPASVKQIMKLLPSYGHFCAILEPHLVMEAVMALRKFAKVVPETVREEIFQFSVSRKKKSMCNFINNVIVYKLGNQYCFSPGDYRSQPDRPPYGCYCGNVWSHPRPEHSNEFGQFHQEREESGSYTLFGDSLGKSFK